jgi:hypothetical protein
MPTLEGLEVSEDVARLNAHLLRAGSAVVTEARARSEAKRQRRAAPVDPVTGEAEPRFKSKLERRAWHEVGSWLPAEYVLRRKRYEGITFHLNGGGRYTPDLNLRVYSPEGDWVESWHIEVKGNWKAYQSGALSKHNLKQAAAEWGTEGLFFVLTWRKAEGWILTAIHPDVSG